MYTYTSIGKLYSILLSRDLKNKKVRQLPSSLILPNKQKVIGYSEMLITYKRIKWTPNRKTLHLLPGG